MEELNLDGIPAELKKNFPNWVNWTVEDRDGKPTKIPLNPKTGGRAKSNNPSTWGSYEMAVQRYRECENGGIEGIGFVLTNGYAGLDLDKCRDAQTGKIELWAKKFIIQLNSYTEVTPSGTGIRVWIKGSLPEGGRKKGHIEMYDNNRFFTVTGWHLEGTPLEIHERQEEIRKIHTEVFGNGQRPISDSTPRDSISLSDSELIKKAMEALNGAKFTRLWKGNWSEYPSQSEADLALCLLLAFWTDRDPSVIDRLFRQSGLMRKKWDERHFGDGRTYGQVTIQTAIERTNETYQTKNTLPQTSESNSVFEVGINFTDWGNAKRLVKIYGPDLRYCYSWGKWLFWDEKHWIIDDVGEIQRRAKNTIALIYREAAEEKDSDRRKALGSHALRCESDPKLKAMVELAKSEPGIPIRPEDMDRNPWLFNVLNGTLDLQTEKLNPHHREDYITKISEVEYDPEADCPFWTQHLEKIMNGNSNLISFLQRAYGYSLTGITDERALFIFWGPGANGKTTTQQSIANIMGDYGIRTPTETLLVKREGSIPNDIARLRGARFVFCSEADEGKRLAEALIKDLTGGDTVSARFMRGEFFDFDPEFKIWLATNHKPVIRGTDNAIWDRIKLIEFNFRIPDSERISKTKIIKRFMGEAPGILSWMVKGCLAWQKRGLGIPDEVNRATEKYRDEMDILGDFFDDCCTVSDILQVTSKGLYKRYEEWCQDNKEKVISQRDFGRRLRERGFVSFQKGHKRDRTWKGIGLID